MWGQEPLTSADRTGLFYALFANGGFRVNPHFIDRIEDQSQHILYQAQPLQACSACVMQTALLAKQLLNPMAPQVITF
ncbi:hypothetical protein [Candidatus Coxiella mudrowiae]|uniref:hypothetical protein n=1 Tax=Candidatus Coxiella mudrowiae TaxID=2054173 RepID=UPI001FD294D3|nr:hypothetical protein [Candidatus Coxiella mudrowiae]